MVHKETRRHRLNMIETPIFMRLIYYQLWNHAAEGLDPEDAEELWKVLIRFVKYQQGRPSYPKFNWGMLASWLKSHKEIVTGV